MLLLYCTCCCSYTAPAAAASATATVATATANSTAATVTTVLKISAIMLHENIFLGVKKEKFQKNNICRTTNVFKIGEY